MCYRQTHCWNNKEIPQEGGRGGGERRVNKMAALPPSGPIFNDSPPGADLLHAVCSNAVVHGVCDVTTLLEGAVDWPVFYVTWLFGQAGECPSMHRAWGLSVTGANRQKGKHIHTQTQTSRFRVTSPNLNVRGCRGENTLNSTQKVSDASPGSGQRGLTLTASSEVEAAHHHSVQSEGAL